jgi:putative endonuclease
MNKRKVGTWYEILACSFLKEHGVQLLYKNYRVRKGEIDIIAKDDNYLCFIEVKYRKDNKYGGPEAAVSFSKQKQICDVSRFFLFSKHYSEFTPIRYDVIAISGEEGSCQIKWHKNAFDYML